MKPETLSVLVCPLCGERLEVAVRKAVAVTGQLCHGILQCLDCQLSFPILNWVPRLLPHESLTEDERSALELLRRHGTADPSVVKEDRFEAEELQENLEAMIRAKLKPSSLPAKLRERQEQDVAYRLHHTGEKGKFIRTTQAYLESAPRRILEVGGGQGGALTAFREHFKPELAILLDIDPDWVEVARLRDPDTDVIRGDATRMPFADGCMEFIFSSATLEHIERWQNAIREMVRVGKQGLICYNPNAGFPYDFGHLDSPLATWLPKNLAARAAFLFHCLRGTGRSLESLRDELAVTFYIHRRDVVHELESCGAEVANAFGEFMKQTMQEGYHIRGESIIALLRRHPELLTFFSKAMVLAGAEPNVYLIYQSRK